MKEVYNRTEEYNPRKKYISFDDMIADMINIKNFMQQSFISGWKLDISLNFITHSYFQVPKDVRLSTTHIFFMKTPNKQELQQIPINNLPDIDFNTFKRLYRNFASESFSLFFINATLPLDNPLRFWKNVL